MAWKSPSFGGSALDKDIVYGPGSTPRVTVIPAGSSVTNYCSECGFKLSIEYNFCPKCGTHVDRTRKKPGNQCNCGAILKPEDKNCYSCGKAR